MIKTPKTEEQALLALTALCSQGEHCYREMQEKMQRWGITEEAQTRILQYLEDERYIDEERFCRAFVHDKMEYNGWGKRKIEQALWLKGIPSAISSPVLNSIELDEWTRKLQPILKAKKRSIKADNEYEMNQKLARFALSRGFTFDVIRNCDIDCDEDE